MTKFETNVLVELKGIKSFIENAVTMDDVKEEISTQIKHTVTECKLEQKTSGKKPTIKEIIFALGVVGVLMQNVFQVAF